MVGTIYEGLAIAQTIAINQAAEEIHASIGRKRLRLRVYADRLE